MANAVGEGIKAAGGEADVVPVSAVSADELKAADASRWDVLQWGQRCWRKARWSPLLRSGDFCGREKDRPVRLLRLGDGQWMRDWEERMTSAGATVVNGEGVIAHEAPTTKRLKRAEALEKRWYKD